jgi:hypothetical protein
MQTDQQKKLAAVLLIVLLGAAIYSFRIYQGLTWWSISQFYVEQTGYVDPSNYWSGSFWVMIGSTDIEGNHVGLVQFNQTLVDEHGANWCLNNHIEPQAEIDIKVTALQPYFTLPTHRDVYMVYPQTISTYWSSTYNKFRGDTSHSVPELDAPVYVFSPADAGTWEEHTPFLIEISKTKGEKQFVWSQTIDTIGGTQTVICANPLDSDEQIMIKDLGTLGTGYSSGPPYTHIVAFSSQKAFVYDSSIINDIKYDTNTATGQKLNDYSYSQYWFGGGAYYKQSNLIPIARWSGSWPFDERNDWSPSAGLDQPPSQAGTKLAMSADWPGWETYEVSPVADGRYPITGDLFVDNPNTFSARHNEIGRGLVGFLERYRGHVVQNLDTWGKGVEITSEGKLKVNMPFGAASSVIEVRVSTEMADALVVKEEITKPIITKYVWLSNQGTTTKISDKDVAEVTIRQDQPDVTGACFVKASITPYNAPAALDFSQQQRQLGYGETYAFKFTLTNNNPGTVSVPGTLTLEALNSNGQVTSTATLYFELLPKGPSTTLTVKCIDNATKAGVAGIPVTIGYPAHSGFDYTDGSGMVTFALGPYVGSVYVQTQAANLYLAANTTTTVKAGDNLVTLLLYRGSQPPEKKETDWTLLFALVVISIVATEIAVIFVASRKKAVVSTKKQKPVFRR